MAPIEHARHRSKPGRLAREAWHVGRPPKAATLTSKVERTGCSPQALSPSSGVKVAKEAEAEAEPESPGGPLCPGGDFCRRDSARRTNPDFQRIVDVTVQDVARNSSEVPPPAILPVGTSHVDELLTSDQSEQDEP